MNRYKAPIRYAFNCPGCGGKTTIRSNRINTLEHQRIKTRLCPNCGDFTTDADIEGNETFRAWVKAIRPKQNRSECPECGQVLFSATGGNVTQAGYTIVYRQCKNEGCHLYEDRQGFRQYPDGREEVMEPGGDNDIGDITQARRRMCSLAFVDCLIDGRIASETLELAGKIAITKNISREAQR